MQQGQGDESLRWAKIAAEAAFSKKATDIVIINVGPTLAIVDYFVLATVDNSLQFKAAIEAVEDAMKDELKRGPLGREGIESGTWGLLDYGDIVVHIFTPQTRDFYRLETLYNDADSFSFEQGILST